MKRIIALLLALTILSFSIISCGPGESKETEGSTAANVPSGEATGEPQNTAGDPGSSTEDEEYFGYLFAYFVGNAPEQERIYFALSRDGYHFSPLRRPCYVGRRNDNKDRRRVRHDDEYDARVGSAGDLG